MKKNPVFWILIIAGAALLIADLFFTIFSIVKIAVFFNGGAVTVSGYMIFSAVLIGVNAIVLAGLAGYFIFRLIKARIL